MNELNFFVQNGWIQDGRIQDGCHHPINQIELVWVRVLCTMAESNMAHFKMAAIIRLIRSELLSVRGRVEWECFWVNLREDNKVSESKMAEFKMSDIIKLSENEWVKCILCIMAESKMARIQNGCHHQVEWEWMNEVFFCSKWLNPRWQNSRWLTSSNWVRMNEFESDWISLSQSFVQNCWIQDGRIQDGCHHQVR